MIVDHVSTTHCGQHLSFWASFQRNPDTPDWQTGNTAQCRVCGRWLAYVWLAEGRYILTEAPTKAEAIAQAMA